MAIERLGIDISRAQNSIDWETLAKVEDLEFVIIRAAQGTAEDSRFAENVRAAMRLKIPFGMYFASSATTAEEAIAEANFAAEYAKQYQPIYGIWYDMELPKQQTLGKQKITQLLRVWCDRVKEVGVPYGIYSNRDWLNNRIDLQQLADANLWYAAYPSVKQKVLTDAPKENRSKLSYPQAAIWQWTSKGRIDGIIGNVDMNVCYKDFLPQKEEKPERPENLGYISFDDAVRLIRDLGYSGIILGGDSDD